MESLWLTGGLVPHVRSMELTLVPCGRTENLERSGWLHILLYNAASFRILVCIALRPA